MSDRARASGGGQFGGSGTAHSSNVGFAAAVTPSRFLRRELLGYTEYAARMPHRLLPGIW